MVGGGSIHYERPPVRRTTFTVYVKPLPYDIGLITKLSEVWSADYPGIKQTSPTPRPPGLPDTDPFEGAVPWPMPRVELVNSSLSQTIAFQFDHLSLTWRFDADAPNDQYPSYEVLAEELITKFGDFIRIVDDVSGTTVEVDGCQCYYSNYLEGIGAVKWLTGYLNGWRTTELARSEQLDNDPTYIGFHVHWADEKNGVNRIVVVNVDEGEKQRPELDIRAVAAHADPPSARKDDPSAVARSLLDAAHELENQTFEGSFSDEMKAEWGAQS